LRILLAVLSLVAAAACREAPPPRALVLSPCTLSGVDGETLCARYRVFENRAAGSGRTLDLHVVVLPALARPAVPDPVFLLAGGPGQSITKAAPALPFLSRLRRQRDIVLVDQRGTGESGPLRCDQPDDPAAGLPTTDEPPSRQEIEECLAGLDADPRFYTTDLAMADLDDVRRALGYERVNLWGGSYGTRAALVYMKMFPDRVRSAVLDGVAPYANRLPAYFPRDADRALQILLADCAAAGECASAFPDLEAVLRRVHARLSASPARVTLREPLTGRYKQATVSAQTLMATIHGALYYSEIAAMIPFMVRQADAGDFGPLEAIRSAGASKEFARSMSVGLFLSVVCAEDAPFVAPVELQSPSLFSAHSRRIVEACRFWPRGTVPGDLREPVISEIPTLLLSGALDPVTPPQWAEEAAKGLSRSRHIVVPGVAHIASNASCVPRLIDTFVVTPDPAALDASCVNVVRRPPFVVSEAGTRP
jgi:pimeloyl-ACP methyl ester carboxylesterase